MDQSRLVPRVVPDKTLPLDSMMPCLLFCLVNNNAYAKVSYLDYWWRKSWEEHTVEKVVWDWCRAYCEKLEGRTGHTITNAISCLAHNSWITGNSAWWFQQGTQCWDSLSMTVTNIVPKAWATWYLRSMYLWWATGIHFSWFLWLWRWIYWRDGSCKEIHWGEIC